MSIKYIEQQVKMNPFWNNAIREDNLAALTLETAYQDNRAALSIAEMTNLFKGVVRTQNIPGDIAEVGVYKGGGSKIIARARQTDKHLYLFDSFEGLPEVSTQDPGLEVGQMAVSFENVQDYLQEIPNKTFIKGMFPQTAELLPSQEMKFSFVHLDMDTYQSTLEGLKYFYPRMSKGGFILMHDYNSISCRGVQKAVDEFFFDKPDPLIELFHTQILCVKF